MDRKILSDLARGYRVDKGKKFRLKDVSPDDKARLPGDKDKCGDEAGVLLAEGVKHMSDLQELLYAQDRWSLLLIFQAMDAAGKDGTIKHVMTGINPQGCQVRSFKSPSTLELDHDFLWRSNLALPERGHIGIFNRSHYEEVLVVRVHPAILQKQHLPSELIGKKIWDHRLQAIAAFEKYLAQQGTVIVKFFLHLSKQEQKHRFLARLDEPHKNWKFSSADLAERGYWDDYQAAYQEAIEATASPHAPWFVVPADNKWFTRLVVVAAMIEALDGLDLKLPEISAEERAALDAARVKLEAE